MEHRNTTKLVTFRKPFLLSGLDGIQPAGTYTIHAEEEMLDMLSFVGWRQTSTTLLLHRGGAVEYVAIDARELREALVRDGDQGTDPPAAPCVSKNLARRARDPMRRGGR